MKYKNDQMIQSWNKVAGAYKEKFMDLQIYNETYDSLISHLGPSQNRVLELGCGPGNVTRYLKNNCENLVITATDVSSNMIDLASNSNIDADFIQLDCREISSLTGKFDLIVLGFLVPYLSYDEIVTLSNDCNELLNNDGVFYLSFVSDQYGTSGIKMGSAGDEMNFYYHDETEILSLFSSMGYQLIERFDIAYQQSSKEEYHTVLIIKRE